MHDGVGQHLGFGPVSEFAVELIAQPRVRKRAWLQRVALPWIPMVPFAVGSTALVGRRMIRSSCPRR